MRGKYVAVVGEGEQLTAGSRGGQALGRQEGEEASAKGTGAMGCGHCAEGRYHGVQVGGPSGGWGRAVSRGAGGDGVRGQATRGKSTGGAGMGRTGTGWGRQEEARSRQASRRQI